MGQPQKGQLAPGVCNSCVGQDPHDLNLRSCTPNVVKSFQRTLADGIMPSYIPQHPPHDITRSRMVDSADHDGRVIAGDHLTVCCHAQLHHDVSFFLRSSIIERKSNDVGRKKARD
jgi:hypothetical protein